MNFAPFGFPTKEPGNITRFGLFPEAGSYLGIRGGSGLFATRALGGCVSVLRRTGRFCVVTEVVSKTIKIGIASSSALFIITFEEPLRMILIGGAMAPELA